MTYTAFRIASFWICIACILTGSAAAQTVSGRVTDAANGVPMADVRVVLLRPDGTRVAETVTSRIGEFHLATWNPGPHRLEATFIGYRTTTSETFDVGIREHVVVHLRLSATAIPLDPLTITARRRDVRDDATHEGFYARQLLVATSGNARVITRLDPEMINARDARDVLTWLPRPRDRPFDRGGQCLSVYWNGQLLGDLELAEMWLETAAHMLEGVEYYRTATDAPMEFRGVPPYLYDCPHLSVLALWQRTGYYGDAPRDLAPSTRRVSLSTALYHVAGPDAPGLGAGLELTAHWPVLRRTALGLSVRRTDHTLSAETSSGHVHPFIAPFYRSPPGARDLVVWTGAAESRVTLDRTFGVWPVLALRGLVARRSFSLESSSESGTHVPVRSTGVGGGLGFGVETVVGGRFALQAALSHERIFFEPYGQLEHRTRPTAAHWGGTTLRIGAGYALQQ
jgi:hypothetical protein